MATGYPAKYAANEKHINTAYGYNILQSFDFMRLQPTLFDLW